MCLFTSHTSSEEIRNITPYTKARLGTDTDTDTDTRAFLTTFFRDREPILILVSCPEPELDKSKNKQVARALLTRGQSFHHGCTKDNQWKKYPMTDQGKDGRCAALHCYHSMAHLFPPVLTSWLVSQFYLE